jgi:hypothetical protein
MVLVLHQPTVDDGDDELSTIRLRAIYWTETSEVVRLPVGEVGPEEVHEGGVVRSGSRVMHMAALLVSVSALAASSVTLL